MTSRILTRWPPDDYCLWVGAGVTMHVGASAGIHIPSWEALTQALEGLAKIPVSTEPFPRRIAGVLKALGEAEFQSQIRELLVRPAHEAILGALERAHQARCQPIVPDVAIQLAHLGHAANPIVNFNLETITSTLLVGALEWPHIVPFRRGSGGGLVELPVRGRFRRRVYHPHGALEEGGLCVLTQADYEALGEEGCLAHALGVHAAFGVDLVIVGMSLDDEYLRQQLLKYRRYIRDIIWYTDSARHEDWARACMVNVERVEWPIFWNSVTAALGGPDLATIQDGYYRKCVQRVVARLVDPSPHLGGAEMEAGTPSAQDWARCARERGERPCSPEIDRLRRYGEPMLRLLLEVGKRGPL